MNISLNKTIAIKSVKFNDKEISLKLNNSKIAKVPYSYTKLINGQNKGLLRRNYRLIGRGEGIHFDKIDEDISLNGILRDVTLENDTRPIRKLFKKRKRY